MTNIAENLSLIGRRAYEQASPFRKRKVVAVPDTLNVSIDMGEGQTEDVPCLSSYRNRATGDRVWMVTTSERGWLVLGRIGAEDGLIQTSSARSPFPSPINPDPEFDVAPEDDETAGEH